MIDPHAHYHREAPFTRLAQRTGVPCVVQEGGQRFMLTPTSRFAIGGGYLHLADRLAWMDARGISR